MKKLAVLLMLSMAWGATATATPIEITGLAKFNAKLQTLIVDLAWQYLAFRITPDGKLLPASPVAGCPQGLFEMGEPRPVLGKLEMIPLNESGYTEVDLNIEWQGGRPETAFQLFEFLSVVEPEREIAMDGGFDRKVTSSLEVSRYGGFAFDTYRILIKLVASPEGYLFSRGE